METKRIGFIGFGEVGRAFALEMRSKGAEVFYYDVMDKKPEPWIGSLSLSDLIERCDVILSTASTHVAVEIAEEAVTTFEGREDLCRYELYLRIG